MSVHEGTAIGSGSRETAPGNGLPPVPWQPPRLLAKVGLAVRRGLQRAADRILPAEVAVFEHSTGITRTMVLAAVAELGVADHVVDRPRTAEELAGLVEAPVDAGALHRVMRLAAVFGLVGLRADGRFTPTALTRVLDSRAPSSMAAWCRYLGSKSNVAAWADLTATVRTGESAFGRVHGMSVWDWFDSHPKEGRTFATAMGHLTELDAPSIAATYPLNGAGTVCDVAGGSGSLLARMLEHNRSATGVLVEAAMVLEEADRHLAVMGLRDRVTFVEGDIFGGYEAAADVYLMKDILHDWDDAACARILAAAARAMPPGSKLVLVERALERSQVDSATCFADIQMMVACDDGKQRSVAELQHLLRGAGLTPGRVFTTPLGVSLVEGIAP